MLRLLPVIFILAEAQGQATDCLYRREYSTPDWTKPVCNPDGSYKVYQCDAYTRTTCWCVYENGQMIPGTAKKLHDPEQEKKDLPDCDKARKDNPVAPPPAPAPSDVADPRLGYHLIRNQGAPAADPMLFDMLKKSWDPVLGQPPCPFHCSTPCPYPCTQQTGAGVPSIPTPQAQAPVVIATGVSIPLPLAPPPPPPMQLPPPPVPFPVLQQPVCPTPCTTQCPQGCPQTPNYAPPAPPQPAPMLLPQPLPPALVGGCPYPCPHPCPPGCITTDQQPPPLLSAQPQAPIMQPQYPVDTQCQPGGCQDQSNQLGGISQQPYPGQMQGAQLPAMQQQLPNPQQFTNAQQPLAIGKQLGNQMPSLGTGLQSPTTSQIQTPSQSSLQQGAAQQNVNTAIGHGNAQKPTSDCVGDKCRQRKHAKKLRQKIKRRKHHPIHMY